MVVVLVLLVKIWSEVEEEAFRCGSEVALYLFGNRLILCISRYLSTPFQLF